MAWSRAIASGLLLTAAPAGRADIVYSGLRDIAIPANFDGVYLDVPEGTLSGSEFAGWGLNFIFGGGGIGNSPALQPVRSGSGNLSSVVNLGSGALVDQFNSYSAAGEFGGSEDHLGSGPGQFAVGQEGYLGFAASISGQTRYGWMRVILTNDAPNGKIVDWAYDNTGATITTGTTGGLSHFIPNDPGLTLLSHAHTYGGLTTVSAGTLELSGGGQPGASDGTAASGTAISDSGILRLNGATIGNEHLSFSGSGKLEAVSGNTWAGPVVVDTRTVFDIQNGITQLSGPVSGGGLEKQGAGTLALSTAGSYTGSTVLSGGILTSAADNILPATTDLILNGGAWNTGGHSQSAASLTLTASSLIDMGGGAVSILTFSSINPDNNWTGGLSIWNWSGTPGTGGGGDQLVFLAGGLSAQALERIYFYSDAGVTPLGTAAAFTPAGELVPVPESAALLPAVLMLRLLGRRRR
ncbi:MAG: autotransporter-associated beta strand repeat-containing protein [Verrucomicrobiota bacterium]